MSTTTWPDHDTMIPDLLRAAPHVRPILDRYGLRGCGGPLGPAETIGYFARAHEVNIAPLLKELQDNLQPGAPKLPLLDVPQPQPGDAIYRPFFKAGIAVVLSLGAVWGAYLLLLIASTGNFSSAGLHDVNAHGHAQIFGWVGLFVMGFAYQAFPRFKHTSLACPGWALASLWMMLGGIIARSVAQPAALASTLAWWTAVVASVVEVAAIVLFVAVLAVTWKRSGKPLAFYDHYIIAALGWFVVQAVYESWYLVATLMAEGEALLTLVATWQPALRDIQIHGFALLMILGVSQRIFHHFYGFREPDRRVSLKALAWINLAVVGEVLGLVLMRMGGHAWAILWYASVLVLTVAVIRLVRSWGIFSAPADSDRSLKFLRTAYGWLFISLAMLVALPAYQCGLLAWLAPTSGAAELGFSHAYYGAIRHAITVGFVSLMIVGVAAKVVPTLNGIRGDALSPLWGPFVLINLGCSLRVVGQTLTDLNALAFPVAGMSGMLEVTGLALWGVHLWLIMNGRARLRRPVTSAALRPGEPIEKQHTVAAVLDCYPALLATFVEAGFDMLANARMRNTLARVVTVEKACRHKGVDLDALLERLNRARGSTPSEPRQSNEHAALATLPVVTIGACQHQQLEGMTVGPPR